MDDAIMIARRLSAQTYPLSDVSLERFAAILVRRELKKGALWLNQGFAMNWGMCIKAWYASSITRTTRR